MFVACGLTRRCSGPAVCAGLHCSPGSSPSSVWPAAEHFFVTARNMINLRYHQPYHTLAKRRGDFVVQSAVYAYHAFVFATGVVLGVLGGPVFPGGLIISIGCMLSILLVGYAIWIVAIFAVAATTGLKALFGKGRRRQRTEQIDSSDVLDLHDRRDTTGATIQWASISFLVVGVALAMMLCLFAYLSGQGVEARTLLAPALCVSYGLICFISGRFGLLGIDVEAAAEEAVRSDP